MEINPVPGLMIQTFASYAEVNKVRKYYAQQVYRTLGPGHCITSFIRLETTCLLTILVV